MAKGSFRKSFQLLVAVLGIFVSLYAYYVETSKESNSDFVALCDINESISCSKVFTSRWGRGMGLLEHVIGRDHVLNQPNSVFGIIFYISLITLEYIQSKSAAQLETAFCILSNCASVWLAYILFIVLEDVCVVCISMYVINFSLLVGSFMRFGELAAQSKKKK